VKFDTIARVMLIKGLYVRALIGCSFRRETTDTTKHAGADHMASRRWCDKFGQYGYGAYGIKVSFLG